MKEFKTIKDISNFRIEEVGVVSGKLSARFYNPKVDDTISSAKVIIEYFFIVKSDVVLDDPSLEGVNTDTKYYVKKSYIDLDKSDLMNVDDIFDLSTINDYASTKALSSAWGLTNSDWEEIK